MREWQIQNRSWFIGLADPIKTRRLSGPIKFSAGAGATKRRGPGDGASIRTRFDVRPQDHAEC